MAKKGVEKIGREYREATSTPRIASEIVTKHDFKPKMFLEAGKKELFRAFYYKDTPDEQKGRAKWIAKPSENFPYTANDRTNIVGDMVEISMDPKYCGSKVMEVEAFMSKPTNEYPAKILIVGTCEPKLISTTWSKSRGGKALSEKLEFGDDVWLNAQLEGCNGTKLEVLIYHDELGEDEQIPKTYITECRNGELNIKLRNTYNWKKYHGWFKNSVEKYYAIIKVKGSRTLVFREKTKLLNFKFEVSSRVAKKAVTTRPLKLRKNEINIERYETCRFKKISIEDDGKPIELFNEDKLKLGGEEKMKEFAISQVINFDLDDGNLRADAKLILDEIAAFLNENPYTPVELGAHCDSRADDNYNDNLSNERARSSVDYLVEKGIEKRRISATGYGKRRLLVNGKNMTEAHHQLNRRVTIKYKFDGTGAIKYQTVVPNKTGSVPRKIKLTIDGLKSTEHCFKESKALKHTDDVIIIDPTGKRIEKKGTSEILQHIYAPTSSWLPLAPLNYILPHLVDPNLYKIYINTCRYYSNKKNNTILISAHPDIRWDFHLYLNLNNPLAVKWQNVSKARQKELFSKAGKIGAEKRWKQTEVSFGALLQAQWNKTANGVPEVSEATYDEKKEYTKEYDAKLKQFYSVFEKIKDASKLIAGGTKSKLTKTIGKKFPAEIEVMPPKFRLGAHWELARGYKNNKPTNEVGTLVKFYLQADPLVGMELTFDLLRTALGAAGPAGIIADEILEWLEFEDNDDSPFKLKIYVNLIVFGIIKIPEIALQYNTASDSTDKNNIIKADAEATIGLTLEAGILIKAKVALVVAQFYFNAEASVEGTGSVTFGHALKYQNETLYYRPALRFDGLNARVVAKAEIGITIKKHWPGWHADLVDYDEEFKRIIRPFDIVESIEKTTGLNADFAILGDTDK
ncbi:OmpA family protein [Aquimarina agarivorans]|uniref:OmpA family protein n=1 Tax=Aquimarina agarivorans TaxID=980584 RepID=UPI000248E59D|nr:OmpA family protein [Aquimarina agarivorans]